MWSRRLELHVADLGGRFRLSSLLLGHGNNVHRLIPANGFEVQKDQQINQCHRSRNEGIGLQGEAISFQVRFNSGGLRGTTFFQIGFSGSLELLPVNTTYSFEEKPLAWLSRFEF